MKNISNFLLVVLIILIFVVLVALRDLDSKVDSIVKKMAEQGPKISTVYDSVGAEVNLKKQVKEKQEDVDSIMTGKPFPVLEFKDLNGNTVNINKLKGKVVLIDFWATWCGPCLGETPNLLSIYDDYKDKGLEIIGISLDRDKQELDNYLESHKISWPTYFDGKGWDNEISSRFGIHGIPRILLLDREGIVRNIRLRGKSIREAVVKLLGQNNDLTNVSSKSYLDEKKTNTSSGKFFLSSTRKGILRISPSGSHEVLIPSGGMLRGIEVLNHRIHVATNNSIISFDFDGAEQDRINIPSDINFLDFTALKDGRFALLDNQKDEVYFINHEGLLLHTAKFSKTNNKLFQHISGIQIADNLIISEDGENHIISIDLKNYEVAIFKNLSRLNGGLGAIECINGKFYLCQKRQIYSFTEGSEPVLLASLPEGNITGIAIEDDWAYLPVNFSGKIYKVNLKTGAYQVFSKDLNYPRDIEIVYDTKQANLDIKDWKEEYIIELKAIDDITTKKFGVNWYRPHKVNISTEKADFITSLPTFRYDMQRYLTLRLGDAENNQIAAVIDFRKPDRNHFPFDLYLDRDRDGDLAEDFITDSKHITGVQIPYSDGTTESYSLHIYSLSGDKSLGLAYRSRAGRYGFFDVGHTQVQLLVIDYNGNGIFNDSEDVLLMDWDLDGKIDGSHQSDEEVTLYSLLKFPGASYRVVEFDPPGRRMVLKRISIDTVLN